MSTTCTDADFIVYPGAVNGHQVQKMLACKKSQVHSRWIPRNFVDEGPVHIKGSNWSRTYPTITVELEVKGRTTPVRMAVNPNIDCDVIMGLDIPNLCALVPRTTPWIADQTKPRQVRLRPRCQCRKDINYAESPTTDGSDAASDPQSTTTSEDDGSEETQES